MLRKNYLHYLSLVLIASKLINPIETESIKWLYIAILLITAYLYGAIMLLFENDIAKSVIMNEVEKISLKIITNREVKKRRKQFNKK